MVYPRGAVPETGLTAAGAAAPVRVAALDGSDDAREEWDEFVGRAADATFFHRAGWKEVLEQTFGFRAHFLTARRAGAVVGVLPLCEMRPPWSRPRLLSLPLAVQAGISADDAAARGALEEAAIGLAREVGAGSVELRDGLEGEAFVRRDVACRFRRQLAGSDEENFAAIPRKRRRMIRLARGSGLRARVDAGLDVFYDLFARSQRRLGTPLLPRSYFEHLRARFADDSFVLTAWRGDIAVAAVLSFTFRDSMLPYYAGSREEEFRYGNNDFLYWELMRLAWRRGLRTFDFGRSRPGSGAFDYKRHWGFQPEVLRYRYHALDHGSPPVRSVDDAGIRLLRWGWRRLPLAMTKRLGPFFAVRFAPYFT